MPANEDMVCKTVSICARYRAELSSKTYVPSIPPHFTLVHSGKPTKMSDSARSLRI